MLLKETLAVLSIFSFILKSLLWDFFFSTMNVPSLWRLTCWPTFLHTCSDLSPLQSGLHSWSVAGAFFYFLMESICACSHSAIFKKLPNSPVCISCHGRKPVLSLTVKRILSSGSQVHMSNSAQNFPVIVEFEVKRVTFPHTMDFHSVSPFLLVGQNWFKKRQESGEGAGNVSWSQMGEKPTRPWGVIEGSKQSGDMFGAEPGEEFSLKVIRVCKGSDGGREDWSRVRGHGSWLEVAGERSRRGQSWDLLMPFLRSGRTEMPSIEMFAGVSSWMW